MIENCSNQELKAELWFQADDKETHQIVYKLVDCRVPGFPCDVELILFGASAFATHSIGNYDGCLAPFEAPGVS
jgi:hypothetical protein